MATVDNINSMGHKFKVIVKMSYRNFPKHYLEETTKNFPSGTYLVKDSDNNGNNVYAI